MPGRILADLLDFMDLTSFKIEHYHGTRAQKQAVVRYPLGANIEGKRVLLVDDVSDSGETFEKALEHLNEKGPPSAVRTAVLHHKIQSRYTPDFHAHKIIKWRWLIYPWALMEDLKALVGEMEPVPGDARDIAFRLREEAGIQVPLKTIEDLLGMMERDSVKREGDTESQRE